MKNTSLYLEDDVHEEFNNRCKKEARRKSDILRVFVKYYLRFGADDIIRKVQEAEVEERR